MEDKDDIFYRVLQKLKVIDEGELKFVDQLSLVLNIFPLPMSVTSLNEGKFISINQAWINCTEYQPEELIGKTFFELSIFPNRQDFQRITQVILQDGVIRNYELKLISKSGKILVGLFSAELASFQGEKVILAVAIDITEKKQVEAKALQLAAIVESSSDAIIGLNLDHTISSWNAGAEKMFGYFEAEITGQPITIVFPPTTVKYEEIKHKISMNLDIETFEGVGITKNGKRVYSSVTISLIRDQQGEAIGYSAIHRNISDKRMLEEERLKTLKLESLSILAGGIAHDFNNFLAGILGNIQLTKMRYKKGQDISTILTTLEDTVRKASSLSYQLLSFAKGGEPIKKATSLQEILKDSAEFILRGSKSKCCFSIPDDLWTIKVDPGQINQVISNIVINADNSMPDGGIIKISAENVLLHQENNLPLNPGKYIKISISDSGIGIPCENFVKIFDPYFTTKPNGNGLGLATSYLIVSRHNGHITIESSLGVGSIFYIYLPAVAEKPVLDIVNEEFSYEGTGRILLMDDEKTIREAAGEMLREMGYGVEYAQEGTEAINLYVKAKKEGKPFDVVIIDLTVPGGLGGKKALKVLQEIDPNIKAIVSSGYSNDSVMSHYEDFGFRGMIAKPYKIEELNEVIKRVMGGVTK